MFINFTITLLEHAINNISKLIIFSRFLGPTQKKEGHTIIWAKMHTTKFLEIKTKKKTKQS